MNDETSIENVPYIMFNKCVEYQTNTRVWRYNIIMYCRETLSKHSKLHFRSHLSNTFFSIFFFFNSELIFYIVYLYEAIADCFFIICLRLDLSDLLMTQGTSLILRGRGVNQCILLSRRSIYTHRRGR